MLVSIIIPMFNSERFISETIKSCLIQSHVHEIILVDDASEDNTIEVINREYGKEPKIKLFKNESNKGPGYSRNVGLKNASGKYLTFFDSDDIMLKKRFEKSILILESNPNLDGTYCDIQNVKLNDFRVSTFEHSELITTQSGLNTKQLRSLIFADKESYFPITSLILRKQSLDKINIQFDPSFIYAEDKDFIYSIVLKLELIKVDEEVKIIRQLHSNNLTSNELYKSYKAEKKLLMKWIGIMKEQKLDRRLSFLLLYRYINSVYLEKYGNNKVRINKIILKCVIMINLLFSDRRIIKAIFKIGGIISNL